VASRIVGIAFVFILVAAPAWPCSLARPVPPAEALVHDADEIVVARANTIGATEGRSSARIGPLTTVQFTVRRLLKGELSGATLELSGSLSAADDPNDRPVPYDFVRPGGRSGSCFAYGYRAGAGCYSAELAPKTPPSRRQEPSLRTGQALRRRMNSW